MATTEGQNRGRSVCVLGGGIAGMAAALAFARAGARVTILEQAGAITEVGAGLQITPNGARVLAALGLEAVAAARSVRAQAIEPRDAVSGRALARFDLTGLAGPPYRFFHRADLIDILTTAAQDAGATIRTATKVRSVAPDGAIALASGERLSPDLAVGADGLHSVLRPALNGPAEPFFTGQAAWRAVVTAEAPPVARIWMAPGRHVVTYPLPGGRLNIVAVREEARWVPEGWSHSDAPGVMRAAYEDLCPDLRAILGLVTEVRLWGLFRHEVAARWHGTAAALIGDAAHPTLPFLAQGANLALEDAFVLARETDRSADLPAALAHYQTRRRARVTRAIGAANRNARAYHLDGLSRTLSHHALSAVGRLAPGAFLRRYDWLYGHDVTKG